MSAVIEAVHYFYDDVTGRGLWDHGDEQLYGVRAFSTADIVDDLFSGAFDVNVSDDIFAQIVQALGEDRAWTAEGALGSNQEQAFQWDRFTRYVKETSRFVFLTDSAGATRTDTAFLPELLTYLDKELGLIHSVGVDNYFYRGRIVRSPDDMPHDAANLGPAPLAQAGANRFSPPGISLFYASADPETAIAEIAGHSPEPYAVIGKFVNTRRLRLLDLTRHPQIPSVFDLQRRRQGDMARFLKSFVEEVTRPIVPDGRVHVEYAPTQVLTDYLRWVPGVHIDGFALPSAQTGNKTYVLFFGPTDVADGNPTRFDDGNPLSEASTPTFVLPSDHVQAYIVERKYEGTPIVRFGWSKSSSRF